MATVSEQDIELLKLIKSLSSLLSSPLQLSELNKITNEEAHVKSEPTLSLLPVRFDNESVLSEKTQVFSDNEPKDNFWNWKLS